MFKYHIRQFLVVYKLPHLYYVTKIVSLVLIE